jgi:hypothetical protein
MEREIERPVSDCPPHHWMVTEQGKSGLQDWRCQRCGVLQEHDPVPHSPPNVHIQRGNERARLARQKGKDQPAP